MSKMFRGRLSQINQCGEGEKTHLRFFLYGLTCFSNGVEFVNAEIHTFTILLRWIHFGLIVHP